MDWNARRWRRSAHRLRQYVQPLVESLGRRERRVAALQYVNGLLLPGQRKSVEPMASRLGVDVQRLQQFLTDSPWDENAIWSGLRREVLPVLGVPEYWVVDETGWLKQGTHSVGVQHQYCGAVGKQANCQVCVQLVVTDGYAALPAAGRLYLPQSWCDDAARLRAARVPPGVRFQTKPEIALELIGQTLAEGIVTPAPVLGDSVYGDNPAFRAGLRALGLEYALQVGGRQLAWRVPPANRCDEAPPETLKHIAQTVAPASWRTAHWKDTQGRSHQTRLAWMPVWLKTESGANAPAQWLIVDWPEQHDEPHHVILAHLNKAPSKARALALSRSRWPIEQHFQRIKDELGFDHLEARSWRAFHHHLALTAMAYSFIVTERLSAQKNFAISLDLGADAPRDPDLAAEAARLLSLLQA
jgi:SRSO17 transposase